LGAEVSAHSWMSGVTKPSDIVNVYIVKFYHHFRQKSFKITIVLLFC
jgi:hypothetical protein